MPKRPMIAVLLTTAALALLLSFKTPYVAPTVASNGGNGGNVSNGGNVGNGGNGANVAGATAGIPSSYSGTVTGSAVGIPFGTVQVQVTITKGVITDVQALQLPNDGGHSSQVSSYAAPQLRSEVLSAQSGTIDTVSGATYTSEGYIQSLQSALSQVPA